MRLWRERGGERERERERESSDSVKAVNSRARAAFAGRPLAACRVDRKREV